MMACGDRCLLPLQLEKSISVWYCNFPVLRQGFVDLLLVIENGDSAAGRR